MAEISNDKKGNESSSPSPDMIIKMWVLLEDHPGPHKLKADLLQVSDLEDFKDVLKEKIQVLKNIEADDIEFLNHDDRNTLIPLDIPLKPLAAKIMAIKPLVICYLISDSSILINFRFLLNTGKWRIPHSSGAWDFLRKKAKELFEPLSTAEITFVVTRNSNDLKIQIKGKKAFGDWTLKEVGSEIYKNTFTSMDSMRKLSLEDFPELNPSFSDDEIAYFIKQLEDKVFAFNNKISTNEATPEPDGSRGYGNLDYEVIIQDVPVLINEAKKQDMEKGIAQNLVQVYIAAETLLGKRKREKVDSLPPMMFGIVTMGYVWRFIRWSGTLQGPRTEITPEIVCNCIRNNYQEAKNVVSQIAHLLQAQSDILKKDNNQDKERDNKRHKLELD
ncbi:6786_t:CDS:2 [Scutellospora calospora]|uniref:6786_t:CDS:1 n=1 Tax=Scutellospora calospora TaxID=85575 RepID=A0ACA9K374_9GLOM|nr:6786_t:CDS:2 [Scutellospora calospora]